MPDIKIRNIVKGTIKTLDKTVAAGAHMKDAFIRTREKAEQSISPAEGSAESEAAGRFSGSAEAVGRWAVHQLGKQGQEAVKTARENLFAVRAQKKQAEKKAAKTVHSSPSASHAPTDFSDPVRPPMKAIRREPAAVKTVAESGKSIEQTTRSVSNAAIKAGEKTVKTTRRSVKTAGQAAQTTAKATQAAQKSAQAAAKTAAWKTVRTAKAAVKATAAAVRAILTGTKTLLTAIAAGGWVAALVMIIICLIGLLVGSCFGIFFSGEDSGSGQTMQAVVQEINTDYQAQIDATKANISYDVLEMSGSRAVWPEVLAIYAVKTTTDPDNAQEVATMGDSKKAILKDIFWQMNEISSRTETNTEEVITKTDDGHGNIVETRTTVSRTYLYITVSHKTAEEMADQYNFSADQRKQLAELLADENRSMWSAVLYGIGTGDSEIVAVALSQIGNVGGEPYWSWYGFNARVEWCACFVSWCANECGYIDAGVIPKFANVGTGEEWFKACGLWQNGSYEPRPGDIIFFDWAADGLDGKPDHVGIVEKVENGTVYTIEGNSDDACRERRYPLANYEILGYGMPRP